MGVHAEGETTRVMCICVRAYPARGNAFLRWFAWARVAKGSRGVMVRKVGGNVNVPHRFCMGDSTGEVST